MSKIFSVVYGVAATTLAGLCVIAALVSRHDNGASIIVAALLGAVVAIPIAYVISKKIES